MSNECSRLERFETVAKVALGAVSLLGIAAMFFGFGFALALSRFGVDVHQVLHGPADYLALSVYPVIELYVYLFRIALDGDRIGLVWRAIAIVLTVVVPLYYGGRYARRQAQLQVLLGTVASRANRLKEPMGFFWPPTLIGTLIAGGLFTAWPLLVIAALSLVAIPTVLGVSYASDYLYATVENPTECRKPTTAQDRRAAHEDAEKMKKEGKKPEPVASSNQSNDGKPPVPATCLKVERKGESALFGRRVIATSEAVVLFDPDYGAVNIVPTKDAVVSVVGSLPTASNPDAKPVVPATPAPRLPARKKPPHAGRR